MTRPESRELLALALTGAWSDGATAEHLHPLLLGTWPIPNDPARAFASELSGTVPLASYSGTAIPRSASAWSVAANLDGSVTASPSTFRVTINNTVPSLAGFALAQRPDLQPTTRLLAEGEVYGAPPVSGGQHADLDGLGVTLHPLAPTEAEPSFYTSTGLVELLRLATGDRMSSGTGLSHFELRLVRDSFSWSTATPTLTLGDVQGHLVPGVELDPPPTVARSPGSWTFTLSTTENLAHVRPAASIPTVYRGSASFDCTGLALIAGNALVAMLKVEGKTLQTDNTVSVTFSVPTP